MVRNKKFVYLQQFNDKKSFCASTLCEIKKLASLNFELDFCWDQI